MLHLLPSALKVSTSTSSVIFSSFITSAPDVMQSSAKSISFATSKNLFLSFILILASKLEPIIFSALFSSMLILQ